MSPTNSTLIRSPIRRVGGKWRAATFLLPLLDGHREFREAFAGSAVFSINLLAQSVGAPDARTKLPQKK